MNKTAIKNYAIWARVQLIEAAKQRAFEYEITADGENDPNLEIVGGRILSQSEIYQRQELISLINRKGYDQVMEEAAYTWFNRFIALRFMEVNGYLPSKIRVFTDENNEFKPEILKEAMNIDLAGLDKEKVLAYLEKQDNEGLYKYLLIAQCNDLSNVLPYMFEQIANWTELLFPANLLRQDGVLGQMVSEIPEEDWLDAVQIIGWLYQYYNTELKDDTFAKLKKNVKISKERIPAATQLFTPDWIVRYMVENSLGRLWYEGHPDFDKSEWKYYLDETEQEPEVEEQLKEIRKSYADIKPEEIKIIDPCMGSGHILVYAFDVLMQIYTSCGWSERDAAKSILENNLYGLDIDDRAGQLAYFAVMMKARKYSRRILNEHIRPKVLSIQESSNVELNMQRLGDEAYIAKILIEDFKDAKEYGSILKLSVSQKELDALDRRLDDIYEWSSYGTLTDAYESDLILAVLTPLAEMARILLQKYDVVVTNPPYMGGGGMSATLSDFVKKNYPDSKSDLFAIFIEKCSAMVGENGYQAMITQHAWMFIATYKNLRSKIDQIDTVNLVHLGARAFDEIAGEVVQTVSFVLRKTRIVSYKGCYCRLVNAESQDEKEEQFLRRESMYYVNKECFQLVDGNPVAYWVAPNCFAAFENTPLKEVVCASVGIQTGDNEQFLRLWWEVPLNNVFFSACSVKDSFQRRKWFPYNKGGEFRKWYGNDSTVIDWKNDGENIKKASALTGHHFQQYDDKLKFQPLVTWSRISTGVPSFRIKNAGYLSDMAGFSLYASNALLKEVLAFCNSRVACYFLDFLAPTLNIMVGSVLALPYISSSEKAADINSLVDDSIAQSRKDWDSFENSWGFKTHPLV